MAAKRRPVLAALVCLVVLPVGCGGAVKADRVLSAQSRTTPLTAEDRLVARRLVVAGDVARTPRDSAQRAFLEFWSAISFEDWATAVRYIDVATRRALQPGYLVSALGIESQNNVPVKPLIRSIAHARNLTSIRYYVRMSDGQLRPTSSTWRRRGGNWYLVYSSMLDESYAAAVQLAVQDELDPRGHVAARGAVSAGSRARRDQARILAP